MRRTALTAIILTFLLDGAPASAGLFQDIYRGLDLFATPSGSPIFFSGDGTRSNGARTGRLRIVPDRVGQGWNVELNRTFGNDSRGRPETLDLGALDLELSGSVDGTFGYTSRGFYIGNAEFNINNLNYTLRAKTGLEDATLTGSLSAQVTTEINQFGFYETSINVANVNSELTVDGVLARNSDDVNFDIGPIIVEGNIFFDATLALLTALGVDTSGLELLSPKSPIDRIDDAIQEAFKDQALNAGYTITTDENGELFLALTDIVGPLPPESSSRAFADDSSDSSDSLGPAVPEPSTLLLVALGTTVYWATRRRLR